MAIDVSIQISTFNRKEIVVNTLKALFDQDYPKDRYEIIVVDDGSDDGTDEAVKSLMAPCRLKYIYLPHNGIAISRNRGIDEAQGEYILFMDDDMIPSKKFISSHMETHRDNPRSIVKGWVNHVESMENVQAKTPKFIMKDFASAFFLGGNSSLMKKYLVEAGKFNENFKEYGWEDLELGFRLRKLGLKSLYNSNAVGFHYKSRWNKSQLPSLMKQARAKGRTAVLFLQMHPNWRVKLATGIYSLRMILNDLTEFKGFGKKIFESIIEKHNKEELTGFSLFCAHQLYKFEYFDAIKQSLKNKNDGKKDLKGHKDKLESAT